MCSPETPHTTLSIPSWWLCRAHTMSLPLGKKTRATYEHTTKCLEMPWMSLKFLEYAANIGTITHTNTIHHYPIHFKNEKQWKTQIQTELWHALSNSAQDRTTSGNCTFALLMQPWLSIPCLAVNDYFILFYVISYYFNISIVISMFMIFQYVFICVL